MLETLKQNYRRKVLSTIIQEIEDGKILIFMKLKSINLKNVTYWVARAWVNEGAGTIVRSSHTLFSDDEVMDKSIPDKVFENILPLVQRTPLYEDA